MQPTSILKQLGRKGVAPLSLLDLRKNIGLKADQGPALRAMLDRLEKEGKVARIKGDKYALPIVADLITGRIRITRKGSGNFIPEDVTLPPIPVPNDMTGTALDGDKVIVRREPDPGKRGAVAGRVMKILERSRSQICGTLQRTREFFYVIPDDPRLPHDIYVRAHPKAQIGDKVVVELAEWTQRHLNPEGTITEVLGSPTKRGVDMLSVIKQYELAIEFPKEVLAETDKLPSQPLPSDAKGRTDCREHLVVTIDPDDAKDFDDALCLEPLPEKRWRLWVHIADVSHYVKPGTNLDKEALERGNSTYLVDRVIPMLPEKLSNGLCSLRPDEERLTKCVEFTLARDGKVLGAKFHSAIIRSRRRFTYQEAMSVLGRPPQDEIGEMLHSLNRLAISIRAARMKAGSLDLDFVENKLRLDAEGKLIGVEPVPHDDSHKLVEECMLLANEAVAAALRERHIPALYRIHEQPDASRLLELREELGAHGVKCGDLSKKHEIQKLTGILKAHPAGDALRIRLLRSLKRARYATKPLGHYGLAKANYTHFTSPIRRYADLLVHRSLFSKDRPKAAVLDRMADHISTTERVSADAEQDSKTAKIYSALILQIEEKKLQTYEGLVTDVRNFGFFVEIQKLGVSGLVPLSSEPTEFYRFEEAGRRLVGRKNKRVIQAGDRLEVQVYRVDAFKKQVDFRMASLPPQAVRPKS